MRPPLVTVASSRRRRVTAPPAPPAQPVPELSRHADASHVQVSLDFGRSRASLVVRDDGRGFEADRGGFGLLGMRERVRLAHGHLDVESTAGGGTRIEVTVPRPARS